VVMMDAQCLHGCRSFRSFRYAYAILVVVQRHGVITVGHVCSVLVFNT
jgi:hypothetical protein